MAVEVTQSSKLVRRLLTARADANWTFADLALLLRLLGFQERVRGSHHIFSRAGVAEIINLQPAVGSTAKVYQVRQVRALVVRYSLWEDDDAPV